MSISVLLCAFQTQDIQRSTLRHGDRQKSWQHMTIYIGCSSFYIRLWWHSLHILLKLPNNNASYEWHILCNISCTTTAPDNYDEDEIDNRETHTQHMHMLNPCSIIFSDASHMIIVSKSAVSIVVVPLCVWLRLCISKHKSKQEMVHKNIFCDFIKYTLFLFLFFIHFLFWFLFVCHVHSLPQDRSVFSLLVK